MQNVEEHLVSLAVKRDHTAFSALHDTYEAQVYRFVLNRTSNEDIAKDITQEVFLKAWKNIRRYKITGAPFISWLIAIARHLVIDHYKKKRNTVPLDPDSLPAHIAAVDKQSVIEDKIDHEVVHEAVANLKGDKKKVIIMRFFESLSYSEIAKALNKTEGAIRVLTFRALKDLRFFLL